MFLLHRLAAILCSIKLMNLTDNETLKFLRGSPILLDDICAIYPATLGEIIDLGYDKFQQYLSVVTATKPTDIKKDDELQNLMAQLTDFQFILFMASIDPKTNALIKEAFRFFTHEEVTIVLDPPNILVGPLTDRRMMDEKYFYDFQHIIKRMYFLEVEGDEIIIYEDDDPATKRIKMQMRANREKVRKAKARQNQAKGSDMKFSDLIGSMTINDCGLNMLNVWDITYYAFHDQLKRMGWRDQFNINQKAALAGAKINKSQLKHWMRSIASGDK